jgi:hypothetical protein
MEANTDGNASMDFIPLAKAFVKTSPSRISESRNGVKPPFGCRCGHKYCECSLLKLSSTKIITFLPLATGGQTRFG